MLELLYYLFIILGFICTFIGWRTDVRHFHALALIFWASAMMGSPNIELVGVNETTGESVTTAYIGAWPFFFVFMALALIDFMRIMRLTGKEVFKGKKQP